MASNVEIDFSKKQGYLAKVREALRQSTIAVASEIAKATIENINVNNQVDTGAMLASVYISWANNQSTNKQKAVMEATAKALIPGIKSKRTFKFDPVAQGWIPKGQYQAKVAVSANYAMWQEFKHMKFISTAFDEVKPRVLKITDEIFKKVLG